MLWMNELVIYVISDIVLVIKRKYDLTRVSKLFFVTVTIKTYLFINLCISHGQNT